MRLSVLISVLVLIESHAAMGQIQRDDDTDHFLAAYDTASPHGKRTLEAYIGGLEQGARTVQSAFLHRGTTPLWCPPNKLALTGPQLVEMVRTEVKQNPKVEASPPIVALLATLIEVFPCDTN